MFLSAFNRKGNDMDYQEFLKQKNKFQPPTGLKKVPELPKDMFDFQSAVTSWACRRGRGAIFAGTGLGKSFMELGRKGMGIELKPTYYSQAVKNLENAKNKTGKLL